MSCFLVEKEPTMGELVRRTDGEGLASSKDTWHEMAGDRRFLFLQRTEPTVLTATWCNREAPHGGRARSASTARWPCGRGQHRTGAVRSLLYRTMVVRILGTYQLAGLPARWRRYFYNFHVTTAILANTRVKKSQYGQNLVKLNPVPNVHSCTDEIQ